MALDEKGGIWKSGKGRGRHTPKGRQLDDTAWAEVRALLGDGPRRRDLLIEYLHLVQDRHGHLSAAHLRALAEELGTGMAEIWEVATFYAHFDPVRESETPPPDLTIRVCDSLSCELAGSEQLIAALDAGMDPKKIRVLRAPCMGRCDTAPVLEIGHRHIDNATPQKVAEVLKSGDFHPEMPAYEDFAAYRAAGGYETLMQLRQGGDWKAVQEKVLTAGLRGLGGAGFPSGKKWEFVRANPGLRYLAVNGDEGEPGTFKDRYYLERTPHLMLEGMLIAAWAVEAEKCFVYMRDEYPAVLEIFRREIAALEDAGIVLPGEVELRRGAGAYICGEESAMIESIEGKRGIPRQRPPYVAAVGIFDRPDTGAQRGNPALDRADLPRGSGSPQHGRAERAQGAALLLGLGPGGDAGRLSAAGRIDDYRHHRGGRRHGARAQLQGLPAGRAVLGPSARVDERHPARLRHAAAARNLHRLCRRRGAVGQGLRARPPRLTCCASSRPKAAASAPRAGSAAKRR